MVMLAERVRNIAASATLSIDAKAKQLKKEGKDVVIFGAGEPDFNTPENIKQAAIRAVNNNFTRYTPIGGIPELKKAIVDKFKRYNKINYDVSEILVSCGGKHSLYNIVMAILERGDEAILPTPYWVSYEEMIKLAEARPIFCETDDKFKLTAEKVK
ncbi:aminotransferase class I/II-fold pyridoxal phosphate-dependent enzyme, partial [Candidatus Woesearchaeota archaeon]|nr:aminotransferase class I/II-fold pyridoxal phosphate-dependent enzyme [Candidatus Woesearchaeota archaeon]